MQPHKWEIIDEGPFRTVSGAQWEKGEVHLKCTACNCEAMTTRTKLANGSAWEDAWFFDYTDKKKQATLWAPEDCNAMYVHKIMIE
jgi:hypothetical protein